MRILLCGAGSIGIRHGKNLLSLKNDIAYFTKKKEIFLKKKIQTFVNLDQGIKTFKPNILFVTNETSKHIDTAFYAAKYNLDVFIEKPISNKINKVKSLIKILEKKKLINMVGYMLRFHPAFKIIQNIIITKKLGRIIHFYSEWGEYLPNWHIGENYKKSYAANESLGGGVGLTLSHDLDIIVHLFGKIEYIKKEISNQGLKIKAETNANFFLKFKNGISGLIHVDYIQNKTSRYLRIIGTKKTLEFFYLKNLIKIISGKKIKVIKFKNFSRNQMFLDELKYFLKNCKLRRKCEPTIHSSFYLLKNAKLIK